MQSLAPYFTGRGGVFGASRSTPDGRAATGWAATLALIPAAMAMLLMHGQSPTWVLVVGLSVFGLLFAINSALHSYLIIRYATADGVSLDVGFYYMANAMGRLLGTLLSGWVYQTHGLVACLWASALLITVAALVSLALPRHTARV